MDFAKKQLEKYGWREGKGLGKNEDGISSAIKPKLKFDNAGIGHETGKEFSNNWWERVYNSALDNVEVETQDGKVKVQVKCDDAVEITTKSYTVKDLKKKNKTLEYQGTFLKTEKLTQSGLEKIAEDDEPVPALISKNIKVLTDEELFAACGGRTAHKGARHGLKLSGKLSRIEKQEKMLLKKLKNVSLSDNRENIQKKIKKISKHKEKHTTNDNEETLQLLDVDYDSRSSGSITPKKKIKNRKKRSVSFSETVTSYTTHDLNIEKSEGCSSDTEPKTIQYTVVKMVKIKEEPSSPEQSREEDGADEGIEQDCDTNNTEENTNHKSFELAQNEDEKSKKIVKSKKQDRATARFLRKLAEHNKKDSFHTVDQCQSCKKRKMNLDYNVEEDKETNETEMNVDEPAKPKKIKLEKSNSDHDKEKYDKVIRKQRKKKNKDVKDISSITKSLNRKCKISDSE